MDQVMSQGVASRTDWIVARVELNPGEETPVNMKQRAMNPEDSTQLTAQLKLWEQQDLITPINSKWNSALLSVMKKIHMKCGTESSKVTWHRGGQCCRYV